MHLLNLISTLSLEGIPSHQNKNRIDCELYVHTLPLNLLTLVNIKYVSYPEADQEDSMCSFCIWLSLMRLQVNWNLCTYQKSPFCNELVWRTHHIFLCIQVHTFSRYGTVLAETILNDIHPLKNVLLLADTLDIFSIWLWPPVKLIYFRQNKIEI